MNETEALIRLYAMYSEGELKSEFDKTTNTMKNSASLDNLMNEVSKLIPTKLEPLAAANAMRAMEVEERVKAIRENEAKVVDKRAVFIKKMSENGGALGLTKQLVEALSNEDKDKALEITAAMAELVHYSDLPKEV